MTFKTLHKKRSLILTLLFVLLFGSSFYFFSGDTSVDRKQLFNYNWKFYLGDLQSATDTKFNDQSWRTVNLPHDWSIEGQVQKDNPSEGDGGFFPMGMGWYRKTFEVPSNWSNKEISIYFEGVYMNSEVFINGNSLGIQPYGYTTFMYELTSYLNYGGTNTIAVKVDNSKQKNSRWYSGSGIYRNVWLKVTNKVHVEDWGVSIQTIDANTAAANVNVRAEIQNHFENSKSIDVEISLLNSQKQTVSKSITKVVVNGKSSNYTNVELNVNSPQLWDVTTPNLYTAQIRVLEDQEVIDQYEEKFGIRTIQYNSKEGFLVNDNPVVLNGGCVHHDNGALGAAAYDRAEYRKVELLKSAGFNAVRTSHNPPSEAFLRACDELGLYVIDESFDGWKVQKTSYDYATYFDQWWKHDITSIVLRDRNHPSIVMWSIGNEIIEREEAQAVETARILANTIRKIDPSRPITSAMTTWNSNWELFDPLMAQHDIVGYNYQLHHAESDHQRVPSRVMVQTESYPKDAFFCWDMTQKHNYIIGDFVWTAMDYLGESGIGRYYYPGEPDGEHWMSNLYPWHGAYCGDIDLIGWRKPISHYRSMLYNSDEKIYMAVREPNPKEGKIKLTTWAVWPTWEHWNWSGHEDEILEVEVYSKYPFVRLYLNGSLVGEQSTSYENEHKTIFKVPYQKGELKAVGVENNEEKEVTLIKTATEPSSIKLTADRSVIKADGLDLSYINIELLDKEGVVNPESDQELFFELEGPGEIIGVDNGNLKDSSLYQSNSRTTWNGKALVIVRSKRKSGTVKLKVVSDRLPSAEIIIDVK